MKMKANVDMSVYLKSVHVVGLAWVFIKLSPFSSIDYLLINRNKNDLS